VITVNDIVPAVVVNLPKKTPPNAPIKNIKIAAKGVSKMPHDNSVFGNDKKSKPK